MTRYIMAVGAHADDIEGNAGGTILKYGKLGYKLISRQVWTFKACGEGLRLYP